MPRLYIPDISILDSKLSITDEKARYLASVLRCKKGDEVVIFDGKGNYYRTTILKTGKKEVVAEVTETFFCDTESTSYIILIQGLLKGEKMDLVIQKTTELGVKEIIPAISQRSQVTATRKLNRWRKIAEEASRQSGRSIIPVIHEPLDLESIFTTHALQEKLCGFIFYEEGGMRLAEAAKLMKKTINQSGLDLNSINPPTPPLVKGGKGGFEENSTFTIFIAIGPEGGFTKEEISLAKEKGLIVVSFGKRILRAETAAISAVTVVQFLLGDIG